MSNFLTSIRTTGTIRIAGLAAAIATAATACGATTIPATDASGVTAEPAAFVNSDPVTAEQTSSPTEVEANVSPSTAPAAPAEPTDAQTASEPAPSADPKPAPATETSTEPEAQPEPAPDPHPEADSAPKPDPAPEAEPAPATETDPEPEPPAPNLAPALDTVRITRQGVNVTVGINASDPDSDTLSLTVVGVLGTDSETFEHAIAEDSGIFQMPFEATARGTVTITTSVTDGTNTTTQVDTIDIAPLLHVIHTAGEIVASNGCFKNGNELTYSAATTSLLLDPRGTPQFMGDVVEPMVLTQQNRGSQLLLSTISSDFEEATGFVTDFQLRATLGDISINYGTNHVQAGRYQTPTFVSPSDPTCWVNIGYEIIVQEAA